MDRGKNFAKMNNETETLIRDLAKSLGTTVEHIYEVMTQQAKAEIVKSIWRIVFLLCFAFVLNLITGYVNYDEVQYKVIHHNQFDYNLVTEEDWLPWNNIVFGLVWLGSVIGWLITAFNIKADIETIIDNLMNPKYQALKDMLGYVNPYTE